MSGAKFARAFVALGSNLGDPRASVESALRDLNDLPASRLLRHSGLYRSAPVHATGPDFVNAVAEVHTSLQPLALLRALQQVEQGHGRVRSTPNAPRTLDLDLLLHADAVVQSAELTLPHPRLHLRAFVLVPLLEMQPTLEVAGLGPLAPWLERCADQTVERLTD